MSDEQQGQSRQQVAIFQPPRLPWHDAVGERFGDLGVTKTTWKPLVESVWPAARTADAVIGALAYCMARRLDPFKKVVHIVPIWNSKKNAYDETVWPGIAEQRTTAMRTGHYAGCDDVVFGPTLKRHWEWKDRYNNEHVVDLEFPEWAQMTVYRLVGGQRVAFVGPKVRWLETYATASSKTDGPNDMWESRPFGQIEKCAEAAALRRAFPEELGDEATAEEMYGRRTEDLTVVAVEEPQPSGGKGMGTGFGDGGAPAADAGQAGGKPPGGKKAQAAAEKKAAEEAEQAAREERNKLAEQEGFEAGKAGLQERPEGYDEEQVRYWSNGYKMGEAAREEAADASRTEDDVHDAEFEEVDPEGGGGDPPEVDDEEEVEDEDDGPTTAPRDTLYLLAGDPVVSGRKRVWSNGEPFSTVTEKGAAKYPTFDNHPEGGAPAEAAAPAAEEEREPAGETTQETSKSPPSSGGSPTADLAAYEEGLAAAPSWLGIKQCVRTLSRSETWAQLDEEGKRMTRLQAWERVEELRAAGTDKTDFVTDTTLFRIWLETPQAQDADAVEGNWRAVIRADDYKRLAAEAKEQLGKVVLAQIQRLRGG